jgi:hypothetical protein
MLTIIFGRFDFARSYPTTSYSFSSAVMTPITWWPLLSRITSYRRRHTSGDGGDICTAVGATRREAGRFPRVLKRFDVSSSTANSNKYLLQKANVQRHLFIQVVMFHNLTVEMKKTLFFSAPQKISIV